MQNFIRVNQRLGIVFTDISNLEKIFIYFSNPETSLIIYKNYIEDLFNFSSIDNKSEEYKNALFNKKKFLEILTEKLLNQRGVFTLLDLIKNLQLIDCEGTKRLIISDFIKALMKTDIFLTEKEKEKIFNEFDYVIDGRVRYEKMLYFLLEQFWNDKKNLLSENIFYLLTDNGKKLISINNIQNYFENILSNNESKSKFIKFIQKFKLIYKKNINTEPMTLMDIIYFLKIYNFGHKTTNTLKELISVIQPNNSTLKRKKYIDYPNYSKEKKIENTELNNINTGKLKIILTNLRNIFFDYGRRTLFNFIKHFNYYEVSPGTISKNNFARIFNNYNINISNKDINIIFNKFGINENKSLIYYEDFLKYLAVNFSNNYRENNINTIYDILLEKNNKGSKDLDLIFLKDAYNPKNNFFEKDEALNRLEFIECLELYHYGYKLNKSILFSKKEFTEFYRFISFLIKDDDDFVNLITNEWNISNKNIFNYNNKSNYYNYDNIVENTEIISKFKNILLKRGVKGIISLHWSFINNLNDVTKITKNDFINLLKKNKIYLDNIEYENLFSYFSYGNYLDYNKFIRFFKKELNDAKLNIVEKIYLVLKNNNENRTDSDGILLDFIKKKYNAGKHPHVLMGKISEIEKNMEFMESFDINFEIFSQKNSKIGGKKIVDFEMFANYFEYVSFIYPEDYYFENVVMSTLL